MAHYICRGKCKGVSRKKGVCNDENCDKYQEPLVKCDCEDNNHSESSDGKG